MAEWFIVVVLKTTVSRGTVGSNPTLTAFNPHLMNNFQRENWKKIKDYMEGVDKTNNPYYRRAVKVVETGTDPGEFFQNEPPIK